MGHMSKVFFGIDLGTTQCSVAYVADSSRTQSERIVTPSLVEFRQDALSASGADRVPSVIGVDLQDKRRRDLLFGWDFLGVFDRRRRDPLTPLRRGRDFFHSVKSDMGTNRVYPFSKPPLGRSPIEVTAGLLERLSRLSSENNPDLDPRKGISVITVPASFSALAREDTLQAAELAGFSRDRVQLLDEPVAALLDTVNHQSSATFLSNEFQHVLMFDFGGGTCDLALMGVRLRGDNPLGLHLETLAISPYQRLGGDDIDRAIMNTIVWPAICEEAERASLPTQVIESVSDTLVVSVARRLKEQICNDVRRRSRERGGWSDYTRLTADVRLEARFSVPGLTFPRSYTMTAAKFEEVMRPFVAVPDDFDDPDDCPQSLVRPIWETIRQAELDPGELHRVILNGGSCLNPFVRRMLEAHLHDERRPFSDVHISEAPSLTCSVARGAALACYWQHARGERLVAPILPDSLGVIVQDGQVEPIVAAGTSLPFPGPDALCDVSGRFAVPPDCGPEMLVPFYTGYAGSPQKPRHAGTVKVKVPSGTPAGSPVTIKLRIDDDKTLAWWFVIANNPPQPADSIRDPWTQHIPDIHERELIEHRRSLRQLADEEKPFPALALMREANFMRRAGDPRGALTLLNDVLEYHGASGAAPQPARPGVRRSRPAGQCVGRFPNGDRAGPGQPDCTGQLRMRARRCRATWMKLSRRFVSR